MTENYITLRQAAAHFGISKAYISREIKPKMHEGTWRWWGNALMLDPEEIARVLATRPKSQGTQKE